MKKPTSQKDTAADDESPHTLVLIQNWLQTCTWTVVLFLTVGIAYKNFLGEDSSYLKEATLISLKVAQSSQAIDLLLSLMKMTKTPFLTAFMQIFQRNLLAWFFLQNVQAGILINILLPWSLADSTRYLYYNFKSNEFLGHLRYNLFLILYPLGMFGELRMLQGKIGLHTLENTVLRAIQILTVLGVAYIYKTLLSQRKKYYASLRSKSAKKQH